MAELGKGEGNSVRLVEWVGVGEAGIDGKESMLVLGAEVAVVV